MRKSKQKEDRVAPAALFLGIDEALNQAGDASFGADGLGEIAGEVQAFIARRNELLRRLNLEIEFTEKKLAELRRTKERLFPEGSVELTSEPERSERKPKKTAKAAKTSQTSSDFHQATASASSESSGSLAIHGSDEELETHSVAIPHAVRSDTAADAHAATYVESLTSEGPQYFGLTEGPRSSPPLTFHPGQLAQSRPMAFGSPAVSLPPCELSNTGPWRAPAAARHRIESTSLLFAEAPLALPDVRPERTHARQDRTPRMLRTRTKRLPRPTRWSRDWASPASGSRGIKVGRNRATFEFRPLFSPSRAVDGVPGLQKAPLTLQYTRLSSVEQHRRAKRRLYKPRLTKSPQHMLPRISRHGSLRMGLKQVRTAA